MIFRHWGRTFVIRPGSASVSKLTSCDAGSGPLETLISTSSGPGLAPDRFFAFIIHRGVMQWTAGKLIRDDVAYSEFHYNHGSGLNLAKPVPCSDIVFRV